MNSNVDHIATRALDALASTRSPSAQARIVAQAVHEAYRLGRAEALMGLTTATAVAAEMGISVPTVGRLARRLGLGWRPAGAQGPLLLTAEEAQRLRAEPIRGRGRPKRLSQALEETAQGFEALAQEDIRAGDPEAAETGQRIAQHLRRLGYIHRAAAQYQQRPELDPEQETEEDEGNERNA